MVRKFSRRLHTNRFDNFLKRHNVSTHYFSINRRLVSRAVLVGVFYALMPIPAQMLFTVLTTFIMRFNVVIALSIVWMTNPITMPFVYYAEYRLGNWLMMNNEPLAMELTMAWFQEHYSDIIVPVTVGAFASGIVLSLTLFFLVNRCWIRSVKSAVNKKP